MSYTKDIGNKAEITIIAELVKKGFSVSIPFGQNDPFDIVVRCGGEFKSIQIKNGVYRNGCVSADIRHKIGYDKKAYSTYDGEADYIAVWCEEVDECYILSLEECNGRNFLHLRIDPPKRNSCISTVVWAKDYTLDKWAESFK